MWIIEGCFKNLAWANETIHMSHLNGFSPVWIIECFYKDHVRVKACETEHTSHLNSFSLVWVIECGFKDPAWAKEALHTSMVFHWCDF